jgi:hypothetical protein
MNMWILILLAGVGGLVWWKSQHKAGAPGAPVQPATFNSLSPGQLYLLNVFVPDPSPDLSTVLVTFLSTAMPLRGAGKVAIHARTGIDPATLPPDVPRPSPGTTLSQWAVPMLATGAAKLPMALTGPTGQPVYVQNAFLVQGAAQAQGAFGFHMNEPGFMSDQTDIYPIGYGGRGWVTDARRHRGYRE